MTVTELIAVLQNMPGELEVWCIGSDTGTPTEVDQIDLDPWFDRQIVVLS